MLQQGARQLYSTDSGIFGKPAKASKPVEVQARYLCYLVLQDFIKSTSFATQVAL